MTKETFSNGVYSQYGYDNASRLTSLNHKKTVDGSLILGYAATYDAASRLTQAVESPNAATTAYAYDDANRLTSEDRTGANPYLSDYTYNSRGLRATAFRSEGGVTSHDGTYTYDAAGRLTQVVEEADGPASYETYTWNEDSTLASYPGPGYTRVLDYDEEGRLTKISRLSGGNTTPKFEYAYGYDGGRRWRKDLDGDVWNWYPCGVACCAGELVVLEATISGSQSWTATSKSLPTISGASHDGSAFTPSVTSFLAREVVSGGSQGSVTADEFGVLRSSSGTGGGYYGGWLTGKSDDEDMASIQSAILAEVSRETRVHRYLDAPSTLVEVGPKKCVFYDPEGYPTGCLFMCQILEGKRDGDLKAECMHCCQFVVPKKQVEKCMKDCGIFEIIPCKC